MIKLSRKKVAKMMIKTTKIFLIINHKLIKLNHPTRPHFQNLSLLLKDKWSLNKAY